MHLHLTPDSVGEAIARIEDLLEFHGMPRNSWSVPWSALERGYTARVLLPEGWSHPDATGTMFKAIEVNAADLVAALIAVGDKFAEAVNFKAAS